jgi:hypothetical protein
MNSEVKSSLRSLVRQAKPGFSTELGAVWGQTRMAASYGLFSMFLRANGPALSQPGATPREGS